MKLQELTLDELKRDLQYWRYQEKAIDDSPFPTNEEYAIIPEQIRVLEREIKNRGEKIC